MRETTLRMQRGDAASFNIVALQGDGVTPLSLVGASLWFTAKHRLADLDAAAVIAKTSVSGAIVIVDGAGGLARVDLVAADTSALAAPLALHWDVQAKIGGRDRTLARGRLIIVADVTRAT